MKDLFGKHDNPLLIEVQPEYNHSRLVAEIFPYKDGGIMFFDIYWCTPDYHSRPFNHCVLGEITEDRQGWRVGSTLIRELDDRPEDQENWAEWERWQRDIEETPIMKESIANRQGVYEYARHFGAII